GVYARRTAADQVAADRQRAAVVDPGAADRRLPLDLADLGREWVVGGADIAFQDAAERRGDERDIARPGRNRVEVETVCVVAGFSGRRRLRVLREQRYSGQLVVVLDDVDVDFDIRRRRSRQGADRPAQTLVIGVVAVDREVVGSRPDTGQYRGQRDVVAEHVGDFVRLVVDIFLGLQIDIAGIGKVLPDIQIQ